MKSQIENTSKPKSRAYKFSPSRGFFDWERADVKMTYHTDSAPCDNVPRDRPAVGDDVVTSSTVETSAQ